MVLTFDNIDCVLGPRGNKILIFIKYLWHRRERFTFILKPAFALASINMTFSSRDFASPSSVETCLKC